MTGSIGMTGPTGASFFDIDSAGNISYTQGTTTLSQLFISTVDYNRLPMGMLAQTNVGTFAPIQFSTSFPQNSSTYLISSTTFTSIGAAGPRKVRTHINLNVEDVSDSTSKSIFITLYDETGTKLKNFSHGYRNNLCTSLNFYHYTSIQPGTQKTFYVYAGTNTNSTGGANISNNANTYNSNAAPPSFVTIEDIGMA